MPLTVTLELRSVAAGALALSLFGAPGPLPATEAGAAGVTAVECPAPECRAPESLTGAAVPAPTLPGSLAPVTIGAEIDYSTRYLWRGMEFSRRPVQQPSFWVEGAAGTISFWGNFPMGRFGNGEPNEIDAVYSTSREWRGSTIEPSLQLYHYPRPAGGPATGEVGVRVSRKLGPLTAYMSHNLDFLAYGGAYYGEAGVSLERTWRDRLTLEGSVGVGGGSARFNEAYLDEARGALNGVVANLEVTWNHPSGYYLRPHFTVGLPLHGGMRRTAALGIAVGREF